MLKELPEENPKLTPIEKKIIQYRLSGMSFCQLSGDRLKCELDRLILKSAAITGCPLPETELFADTVTSEIIIFMNEFGYETFTCDEILLALRLNSKGGLKWPSGMEIDRISFSGNCFNIDFLAKILSNYASLRNNLERKIQNSIDGYE